MANGGVLAIGHSEDVVDSEAIGDRALAIRGQRSVGLSGKTRIMCR